MPARLITAFLKSEALQMQGSIMRLAEIGFLAELNSGLVSVGDKFEFSFELPNGHKMITGQGVIVKVYNHFSGAVGSRLTAEIHFRVLSQDLRNEVSKYVRSSGQMAG